MKARPKLPVLVLFTGIAAACFYLLLFRPISLALHNMPRASDALLSYRLVAFVADRFPFIKAADETSASTIYAMPLHKSCWLQIYGVTNKGREDQMLAAVQGWQSTNRDMAEISLRFYARVCGRSRSGELEPGAPIRIISVRPPQ